MFKYGLDNKRYHTLNYYLKNRFHEKVYKVSLNAGFTCPNIDGTKGYGGCIYCSKTGSGEFGGNINDDLITQFNKVKEVMDKKWHGKYIAYFQARSNTYAPVNILKERYETVLKLDNVIGLFIATRCDCITDECLDYLTLLNKRTYLTIELGLQTIHESISKLINRGHTLKEFTDTVKKLRERNIDVVVHIINGLPYETKEDILSTAEYIGKTANGIKLQLMHILKNTKLLEMYEKGEFKALTEKEYIEIVCEIISILPREMVTHRLTGDGNPDELIAPLWSLRKLQVLNGINHRLKELDIIQGIKS